MVVRLRLVLLWLLCTLAGLLACAWMLASALAGSNRAWRLAVAHDQLVNVVFGGHEDETISSRAGKAARRGRKWGCLLCRFLDRLDPNHCEKSIEHDRGKPTPPLS